MPQQVLQNEDVTVSVILEDDQDQLVSGISPSDVVVFFRKSQQMSEEKTLTSSNFREVDATNMPGVYEIDFTATDMDTLGEVLVQIRPDVVGTFEPTHLHLMVANDDIAVIISELDAMQDTMSRIVGLTQENMRITDHVYSGQNKLSEATIELYETSSMSTLLATYKIEAEYDPQGLMTKYDVVRTS